jgi:hypothetical protein
VGYRPHRGRQLDNCEVGYRQPPEGGIRSCGFDRTGLLHLGFIDVPELKWNLNHVDVNLVK